MANSAPLSVYYFSLCECPAGTLGLYSLQTGALERGKLEGVVACFEVSEATSLLLSAMSGIHGYNSSIQKSKAGGL